MTSLQTRRSISARRSSRHRRRVYWIIAGVGVLAVIAVAAAGPITSLVEQPPYKLIRSDGAIEVRSYEPMIIAEAVLLNDRRAALSNGFQLIASYIFGANDPNTKIAMTAPVEQQVDGEAWAVRFIMPAGWSMDTLPSPTDPRVTLKPIAARTMLAIRFSGIANASLLQTKTDELRRYAGDRQIETLGEPVLAFYNPPWTLPFLRRNEVLLQMRRQS